MFSFRPASIYRTAVGCSFSPHSRFAGNYRMLRLQPAAGCKTLYLEIFSAILAKRYPSHASRKVCLVNRLQSVGVTLNPQVIEKIDELAKLRGVSRSEAIRISVDIGLPLLNLGIALNAERALTILEHTQLALSLLVERQYPDDVPQLVNMALNNVREYHG